MQFVLHFVVVVVAVVVVVVAAAVVVVVVVVDGVVIEQAERWDPTEPYPLLVPVQASSAASVAATFHPPALSASSLGASPTPPNWAALDQQ